MQDEEDQLLGGFQNTNNAADGILMRLKALDQLAAGSSTLQMARLLLFLLFLVIEVLPVTVKLLQQPGNYEKILKKVTRKELSQAEWELRGGPGSASAFDDEDSLRPMAADAGRGARRPRPSRRSVDDELKDLFAQRTQAQPRPGWKDAALADEYQQPAPGSTGPQRMHGLLSKMRDIQKAPGADGRPEGIERLYGDDDL